MQKHVLVKERHQAYGIKENHRGFPHGKNLRVFGADTETARGKIFSIQIASEGDEILIRTTPETAFRDFMSWVYSRTVEKGSNLIYFHNLRFDITVLLTPEWETLYNQYNDIHFDRDGYRVNMFYGRVNFARIRAMYPEWICEVCGEIPEAATRDLGRSRVCGNPLHGEPCIAKQRLGPVVSLIDSAAFCPPGAKSLQAALKIYGVSYKKLTPPDGLGERILTDATFEAYAMNDARAEEALGLAILELHKEYDITPCISLPQLSGRILRHHFFKAGETFPFPPESCRLAAELSYHAGKNGFYVKPGVYEDLIEYDINSAFPKAMREMPQMVKGKYEYVKRYRRNKMGIYRITGQSKRTLRYPIVFDAAFRACRGDFENEWITGYEMEILQKDRHYRYRLHDGWIWHSDKTYDHSPLAEFVARFWQLKSTAPKGPKRDTYKNILNSLYGKFAACAEQREVVETAFGPVAVNDGIERPTFVAGALYHPFIATQITGYVRAELWRLEQRGLALHAATDSIKSRKELPTSNDLGGIKKEVEGRCYLFRNKLYLHFAKDTSLCGHNLDKGWLYVSKDDQSRLCRIGSERRTGYYYDLQEGRAFGKLFDSDGQHLCKFGLHGFKGSVFYLYENRETLLKQKYLDYEYDHMVSFREGIKRREIVCHMTRRKERLTLASSVSFDPDSDLQSSPFEGMLSEVI